MEKRTIELSIDKAKRWYKSGGEFKQIALEAYTEEELTYVKPLDVGELPKTWKEFCEHVVLTSSEYTIDYCSEIETKVADDDTSRRDEWSDRNLLPSKKDAESHLALMQLHQLRDYYRQGWKPDLHSSDYKYIITKYLNVHNNTIEYNVEISRYYSCFLCFQSKEIAEEFLKNFNDLIKTINDLI